MADPFDFSTADPNAPGFLGQSVGFWRDLASFGGNLAAAANQRTASGHLANGTGFAGPLGVATTETMKQGMDNALNRSKLAYQGAQTQNAGMQNQLLASQLPLALAKNTMLQRAYSDPSYMKQLLDQWGGGGAVSPMDFGAAQSPGSTDSSSAQIPGAPSSYSSAVMKGEGTGQNGRSSASGYGQFIDSTWGDFAKENPHYFAGMTPDQVMAARNDPKLGAAATDWLAGRNAHGLTSAGVQPTGQSLAMAHFLGPQAAAGVMQAPDNAPVGQVLVQTLGQDQANRYVQANPNLSVMTAGALRNRYAAVPTPSLGGGGQQQPGRVQVASLGSMPGQPQTANDASGYAPAPQQGQPAQQPQRTAQAGGQQAPGNQFSPQAQFAFSKAQQYEREASRVELMKSLGIPVAGDPAALRQAGGQWLGVALAGPKASADSEAKAAVEMRTAGPIQAQKSANSNVDLRPGGMSRVVNADGSFTWVKNPQYEQVQDENGNTVPVHVTPPVPGSPPGTPGEATPILGPGGRPIVSKLPQNVQEARNKVAVDFMGKDSDSYLAAQNTQSWLTQMDHAADVLNQNGGFLQTGPGNTARAHFASMVNDVARTTGLPMPFDPNKIASWEEYKKATTTAGFELSSHYEGHARQAAQTIMNATSAVPSPENSPIGAKLVTAGIQEAAQSAIDMHEFKQRVFNRTGDLTSAETDFYKQTPAQMYARRAISTVNPYDVKAEKDFSRYLPGTYVRLPNGKLTQVPERSGSPGIPEYMRPTSSEAQH